MIFIRGTIRKDSPRYAAWKHVFGSDTVPLMEPLPRLVNGPRGLAEFYRLSIDRLNPAQKGRLVDYLSAEFGIPRDSVQGEIEFTGFVPILAADVTVTVDARAFL